MCNKESFWPTLCDYINRKDLGIDKRFSNFKLRQENRDLITDILDKELSKKSTSEWLEIFAGNVPAAPILDIKSSLENEFVKERNNIQSIITKNNKKLSLLKTPIRFDTENHVDKTAPELGEHNEEILTKLGYSNEDIKLLKNKDII